MRSKILVLFALLGVACSCSDADMVVEDNPVGKRIPYTRPEELYGLTVNTPDGIEVTSKEVYIEDAEFNCQHQNGIQTFAGTTKIKGRGNSTWTHSPKKSYRLKLDKKAGLAGMPEDKSWVLLGNYFDPTLMRNDVAFFMGHHLSELDYTPRASFTTLTMNGEELGVYQIVEKLKISKDRVNAGEDGFLLEIDAKPAVDDVTFTTDHLLQPVNIKEPDVTKGDDNYVFIKNYVTKAEDVLFSPYFLDSKTGYRNYFDVDSFVEWYLINEISKNPDAWFYTSCYMNLKRGGKLKMGPIWDFDVAFGNYHFQTEEINAEVNLPSGFQARYATWIERMFEDSYFKEKVKERFTYYYEHRTLIFDYIDKNSQLLIDNATIDNYIWGQIGNKDATKEQVKMIYTQKVTELKNWLEQRCVWLRDELKKLK